MTYAIIKVAGKQYRVREGERLLVDRLHEDDGATFTPTVLLVGGDGAPQLEPGDGAVTAKVLGDTKGPKIRIGKYKKRTGYQPAHGLPRVAHADPDRVDRWRQAVARDLEAEGGEASRGTATGAAEAPDEHVKGMPSGYEDLTVAEIKEASSGWNRPMLAAALEYEQAHAKRKGAIAALESALAAKEGDS